MSNDASSIPPSPESVIFQPKLLTTMRGYSRQTLIADLFAGLAVALVALPLSLAIAIASGAKPQTGLVTAVVGGFLISALGGSRFQIGGPTGAFIVVVYGVIATHGFAGLVTATFMAGIILIAAGLLRAGSLIRHVPEAVINGFTIGIAIIIAASQLADFFGLSALKLPADLLPKLEALWAGRDSFNPAALALALATTVAIVVSRKQFPRFPGLLFAVVGASLAVPVLGLPVETIADRFGAVHASIAMPHLPQLGWTHLSELLPSALVIAFLAGVESLLSATVADRQGTGAHRPNTEVIAQGIANCASALVMGLPVTGAIARTATNIAAGGKTPVAGMAHALFLLLFLLVAGDWVGSLAMPALAAVLMVAAWNMAEVHRLRQRLAAGHPAGDRMILVLTCLLTAFVDLTVAIGVGVALGLLFRLRRRGIPETDWQRPER
jgi:SulP family sulfate permease